MDLRDFGRALARGWWIIVAGIVLGGAGAAAYLAVVTAEYEATSTVVLVANQPTTISDAQQGAAYSAAMAATVATMIDSAAVLDEVQLDGLPTEELALMTTTAARVGTSTIDIVVRTTDPDLSAELADTIANRATEVIPPLLGTAPTAAVVPPTDVTAPAPVLAPPVQVLVLRTAVVPTDAVSPSLRGTIVIGLALGLCLGLIVAIAREGLRLSAPSQRVLRTRAPLVEEKEAVS